MTRLAPLLALLLALAGCAGEPHGAHLLRTRETAFGRVEYWHLADGTTGRLFYPAFSGYGPPHWLKAWEFPE